MTSDEENGARDGAYDGEELRFREGDVTCRAQCRVVRENNTVFDADHATTHQHLSRLLRKITARFYQEMNKI